MATRERLEHDAVTLRAAPKRFEEFGEWYPSLALRIQ